MNISALRADFFSKVLAVFAIAMLFFSSTGLSQLTPVAFAAVKTLEPPADVVSANTQIKLCHNNNGASDYSVVQAKAESIVVGDNDGHPETKTVHQLDIIPPFDYDFGSTSGFFPGRNWDDAEEVYRNGCSVPALPGMVTIKKDGGGDGDDVSFHFTGDLGAFDVLGDNIDSEVFGDLEINKLFTIAEEVPEGWSFESVSCVGGEEWDTLTEGAVSVTVASEQNVICTFVNSKDPVTDIPGCTDPAASNFDAKATVDDDSCLYPEANITLLKEFAYGDADPIYDAEDFSFFVEGGEVELGVATTVTPAGPFTISETGPVSEFDLEILCDGGSLTDKDLTVADTDDVTCTLTNTFRTTPVTTATIVVEKEVTDGSDVSQSFDFSGSFGSFSLKDGESTSTVVEVASAPFSVSESVPTDWTQTDVVCVYGDSSTSSVSSINPTAGETVTCTFTNDEDDIVIPAPSCSITADPNPVDENADFVLEWTSTNAVSAELDTVGVAVNSSTTESIAVDTTFELVVENSVGATSTCSVLVEVKDNGGGDPDPTGTVKIVKELSNSNDTTTEFTFDPSWSTNFTLVAGASTSVELDVNTYSVEEINIPDGWALDDVVCLYEDSSTTTVSNISVLEDETVVCTFVNEEIVEETFLLYGYVWEDENENDTWDGEQLFFEQGEGQGDFELPMVGWTVKATNGDLEFSTTTDSNGYYYFNLPAGTWTITEILQNEYAQTFPNNNESYEVVVGTVANGESNSFFASVMDFFIPTAHAQVAVTTFGPFNFGVVFVGPTITTTGGGGGGGTPSPRCDLFEGDVSGDDIKLKWETRNGRDLKITANGVEIYKTSVLSSVDDDTFDTSFSGATEFELTVYRSTRNDTCTLTVGEDDGLGPVGPTPQVLGEQVSVVPLGAADAGAGGTSGSNLPSVFTILFLLASVATLRVTRADV